MNNDQSLTPLSLSCDRPLIMAIRLLFSPENPIRQKQCSSLDIKDRIKTLLRKAPQKQQLFIPTKECPIWDRVRSCSFTVCSVWGTLQKLMLRFEGKDAHLKHRAAHLLLSSEKTIQISVTLDLCILQRSPILNKYWTSEACNTTVQKQ